MSQGLVSTVRGTLLSTTRTTASRTLVPAASTGLRFMSHGPKESDEEFDARYVAYFSRNDIDGWEIRKGMTDLVGMDLIPEPKIITAALRACRKVNDYALTIRFLEALHMKCQTNKDLWPYVVQEIKPTLDELGANLPEDLGYDKPELALKSVFDVHG